METAKGSQSMNGQQTLVLFRLGPQAYALPIEPVIQVIERVTITPIPQVSRCLEGLINFHGAVVPVVNLRRRLGMTDTDAPLDAPIILVRAGERPVGLTVDEVSDVRGFPVERVLCPADILPEELSQAPLLYGVVHAEEGVVLVLDVEGLWGDLAAAPVLAQTQDGLSPIIEPDLSAVREELPDAGDRRRPRRVTPGRPE